jgi:DNA mismatch endonuclease (patch repair protein)
LWRRGLRYFTHDGFARKTGVRLEGRPDIIFSRLKVVVFVDGCFWHGCRRCGGVPATMSASWQRKLRRNVQRDQQVAAALARGGWKVIRVPEHSLKTPAKAEHSASRVAAIVRARI